MCITSTMPKDILMRFSTKKNNNNGDIKSALKMRKQLLRHANIDTSVQYYNKSKVATVENREKNKLG